MVKNYDDMLSRFHLIPERYGQICYMNIARKYTKTRDDKNDVIFQMLVHTTLHFHFMSEYSKLDMVKVSKYVSNNVLIKVTLSRQRHCRGTV